MALMIAAAPRGAVIPRNKDVIPPNSEMEASIPVVAFVDVCNRTLMVSKGCPTMTDADPATPPAMKSCKNVISLLLLLLSSLLSLLPLPLLPSSLGGGDTGGGLGLCFFGLGCSVKSGKKERIL